MSCSSGDRNSVTAIRPFVLLSILIVLVYGNTFQASWHLDDYSIIVDNPRIHLTELRPDAIRKVFTAWVDRGAYESSKIYRPIPCLTFALNWYVHGSNVLGYHLVNILIHLLSACLLYLVVYRLQRIKSDPDQPEAESHAVALLAASLWAIHPIQTQSVTYIVQRMAALGAMFYLGCLLFYIRAKIDRTKIKTGIYYTLSLLCFGAALGSKENTVTLPIALILLEICFFSPAKKKGGLLFLVITGLAGMGICVLLFFKGDFQWLTAGYSDRPFTLGERLMTEARIVIYYLSQIVCPTPGRLSVSHGIPISTGLLQPWTTLPSIAAILMLLLFACIQTVKRPAIAFAILFFLLNHVPESSILPLELMFEHRNYLPSLFLFWPVADILVEKMNHYRTSNPSRFRSLAFFTGFLFIWLGSNTYIRNETWRTEKSLWEDAVAKAPGESRPLHNLARGYYEKIGRYDTAIDLYRRALELNGPTRNNWRTGIHNNLGILLQKVNAPEQAIDHLKKAVEIEPKFEIANYNLVIALIKNRQWKEADRYADMLLKNPYNRKEYYNLKGFILIRRKQPEAALSWLETAVRRDPSYVKALLNLGGALTFLERYDEGLAWYKRADQLKPNHLFTLLYMVQNRLMAKDVEQADYFMEKLLAHYTLGEVGGYVDGYIKSSLMLPFAKSVIAPYLADYLIKLGNDILSEP